MRHAKKREINRFYAIALLVVVVFIAGSFSAMKGDPLVLLSQETAESVLTLSQPFYSVYTHITASDFGSRNLNYNTANDTATDELSKSFEFSIHTIIFFILTLFLLLALKILKLRLWTNVLLTSSVTVILAFCSELYQNGISRRGYEDIDVILNLAGFLLCLFVYLLITLIVRLTAKRRTKKILQIKVF